MVEAGIEAAVVKGVGVLSGWLFDFLGVGVLPPELLHLASFGKGCDNLVGLCHRIELLIVLPISIDTVAHLC